MKKGQMSINVNDIVGKRLGKLEILWYAGYLYEMTMGGARVRHFYVCKCDCGKMLVTQRGTLKNEKIHSCGCSKYERKRGGK